MKSRLSPSFMIIVVILVVLAIIGGIFFTFGSILGQSFLPIPPEKNVGITTISDNKIPPKMGLRDVFVQIAVMNSENKNITPEIKIFSVTGLVPDGEGKADSWLLITKQGNEAKFIEYNERGVLVNKWYGDVAGNEINPDNTMSSEDLFLKHQSRLRIYLDDAWNSDKLELINGTFTLSLKKGTESKIFVFNAKSGEIIRG